MGAFGNFATSSTNYHELFPGIRARLCTLVSFIVKASIENDSNFFFYQQNYHFWAPFYRDMLLSWGLISSNRNSLMTVLSQSNNKLAVNNYDGFTANAVSFLPSLLFVNNKIILTSGYSCCWWSTRSSLRSSRKLSPRSQQTKGFCENCHSDWRFFGSSVFVQRSRSLRSAIKRTRNKAESLSRLCQKINRRCSYFALR